MNDMTVQEAIHIIHEEAVHCERMAADLAEVPVDDEGKCMGHARDYRKKAEAMRKLLNIAQLWLRVTDE